MRKPFWIPLLATLSFGIFTTSCDLNKVEIDPIIQSTQYFTIFGYLDMGRDVQYLRVIPVRGEISLPEDRSIDAVVTTTDLTNGEVITWRDSVINFDNGSYGHVFYAPIYVQSEHTYRLEIKRADGGTTTAETTVPTRPEVTINPPKMGFGVNNQVVYSQPLIWKGIEDTPYSVEVWYRLFRNPNRPFSDIRLVYEEIEKEQQTRTNTRGKLTDDGWEITALLSDDQRVIEELNIANTSNASLYNVGMRVMLQDNAWRPPGGVWNPEILVQPSLFSNVTNGFGFFGSIGQFDVEWALPNNVIATLGFAPPIQAE